MCCCTHIVSHFIPFTYLLLFNSVVFKMNKYDLIITCFPSAVSKPRSCSSQSASRGFPSSHSSPFTLLTNAPFTLSEQIKCICSYTTLHQKIKTKPKQINNLVVMVTWCSGQQRAAWSRQLCLWRSVCQTDGCRATSQKLQFAARCGVSPSKPQRSAVALTAPETTVIRRNTTSNGRKE